MSRSRAQLLLHRSEALEIIERCRTALTLIEEELDELDAEEQEEEQDALPLLPEPL